MNISYNWLCDYLPEDLQPKPDPRRIADILTSVGLEVETMRDYTSVRGGLEGLVVGEVLSAEQHPNADKLKITKVNTGTGQELQIVCGASNVAAGQKVVVALIGTTLYPETGEPFQIKAAKIRGIESQGMLCAEDEIGLGKDHEGILILPQPLKPGSSVADYFKPYSDQIFEIGLTPNHMDAMSHLGVARDVCAYLSHHENKNYQVHLPPVSILVSDDKGPFIDVSIENKKDCSRFSGLTMTGIRIYDSPKWMQDRLRAIGTRPINNVVDITNFILNETGQPLHAYDIKEIKGNKIIVKNLPEGTAFVTLDEKQRKLHADDLMICDAESPIGMAGVSGGLDSGIRNTTTEIFLESAWFNPSSIRRTSTRHGLRTDAAVHFEKGMDISATVSVLKRTASLLHEYAGAVLSSSITDEYPDPQTATEIELKYNYLRKLSGKKYEPAMVKTILASLGFTILRERTSDGTAMGVAEASLISAPFSKPDMHQPADLVEEIMRIDGLDQILIPANISISPSVEKGRNRAALQEKISNALAGLGFNEIFTNSITNSSYFSETELSTAVKMINNLSADLNLMRPSLLETGLESISWNLNRKNSDLRFFEFGKTYSTTGPGMYKEINHCCLYLTGHSGTGGWKGKANSIDFFYLKGVCSAITRLASVQGVDAAGEHPKLSDNFEIKQDGKLMLTAGEVNASILQKFDIRQPVFFADIYWDNLAEAAEKKEVIFSELPRQNPAYRDLAMIVAKNLSFATVEKAVNNIGLQKLRGIQLFDIFESEKLGTDKKSMAISFRFLDNEKTLTDKEIDGMMNRIMKTAEEEFQAEIRKY